jgi:hypothetical protein
MKECDLFSDVVGGGRGAKPTCSSQHSPSSLAALLIFFAVLLALCMKECDLFSDVVGGGRGAKPICSSQHSPNSVAAFLMRLEVFLMVVMMGILWDSSGFLLSSFLSCRLSVLLVVDWPSC